ncbi:MAG: hypothetical protein ABS951_08205 [Solibacillus sp.]
MKNTIKALFICALIIICAIALTKFVPNSEAPMDITSKEESSEELLKQQTTTAIATIVTKQLLENAILNITIAQQQDGQHVELLLQSNEFVDEATLLMDTYNILHEVQDIEHIKQITVRWHRLVENKNTEVLTLTVSKKTLATLSDSSHEKLPELADVYEKHPVLQ